MSIINNKTRIYKRFNKSFVLNKSKSFRINDIIESSLKKNTINNVNRIFKLSLNNEKEIIFQDFNDIFEVDNGRKNKIENLRLIWSSNDLNIEIYFQSEPEISIEITSSNLEIANQIFAEIEEQIERVTLTDWLYLIINNDSKFIFYPLILMLFTFLSTFIIHDKTVIREDILNLSNSEKILLIKKADSTKTNDDKIDFIYTSIRHMIKIDSNPEPSSLFLNFLTNYKNYTIIVPIIVCILMIWYVLAYCYPKCVFEWGDMADDYLGIIERRKLIWNILIGSIIVGIITNFFVWGITN